MPILFCHSRTDGLKYIRERIEMHCRPDFSNGDYQDMRSMMSSNATDTKQVEPVGERTVIYLKKLGYSDKDIASWTSHTSLLKDLGWDGDTVECAFQTMQNEFGVDFSGFEFEKYFPIESSKEAGRLSSHRLLNAVGLGKWGKKNIDSIYSKYPEITFGMIEEMIKQKKWIDP